MGSQSKSWGRARHLDRRRSIRHGIPDTVPIPKFMEPKEIREVVKRKRRCPDKSWEEVIRSVIKDDVAKK
jgi:hypothetical protein